MLSCMSFGFQMGLLCMSGAHFMFRVKNKDVYVGMSEPSGQKVSLFSGQSQILILLFVSFSCIDIKRFCWMRWYD